MFGLFDFEKKGKIGIKDLRRACRQLGEALTDDELFEMINAADKDQDGMVTKEDFYEIVTKNRFP